MLSSLARGCGSWTGDLEVADLKAKQQKPVLVPSLNGENTKFLQKSVKIPLRVKSAVSQSTSQSTSISSLARTAKTNTPKNLPSRPKSVCANSNEFHKNPREKIHRAKSAASIFSQRSRSGFGTCTGCLSSTSNTLGKYGPELKNFLERSKSKTRESDGTVDLPKTYMTRKGALMLFTAPENLLFSETDQKCYFKNDQDQMDIKELSLTLGTVNKLTTSVLRYGSQHQLIDDGGSDTESWRDETHMQFVHNDEGDLAVLDYKSQPGAEFVFYLKDLQSRAVMRSLVRTPSQQSLVSVDSATELNAALQDIDTKGSPELRRLLVPDPRKLVDFKQQNTAGIQPKIALSRPSTSASRHSMPLSVEHLAASLKSSPYLGHPLKAPYPPHPTKYSSSPATKPLKTSGSVRQGSAHSKVSTSSREQSSAHSVRSLMSSHGQGSHDQDMNKISSESAHSITTSHSGSLSVVDDDESYRDITLSGLLSPTHGRRRQQNSSHYSSEANVAISGGDGSQSDGASLYPDAELAQDQPDCIPIYYKSTSSGTASPRTYISATTSVPTTVQDEEFQSVKLIPDDSTDQYVLSADQDELLDHDALLLDHDALLLDNPSDQESLDEFPETSHSGQWPVDRGVSPVLSVRLEKSPNRTGSEVRSFSPGPEATSPSLSVRSGRSLQPDASLEEASDVLKAPSVDRLSPVIKVASPAPAPDSATMELQDDISPTESQLRQQQEAVSRVSSAGLRSPTPRLPPRRTGLADVVNRVAEDKSGMSHTTLVPTTSGLSDDLYATTGAGESTGSRKSPLPPPERKATLAAQKPTLPAKTISKLDLGNVKAMVKPPAANKTQSPRTARKGKGKEVRPKSTGVQFIDSLNIDSYQGPTEDEVEKMVQQELAKDLESGHLEQENISLLIVTDEKADDVVSVATDDEALEKELKKQSPPGKKRSKKSLAKEKAALREARRQEKLRREEELKTLQEKKKQREKEKRRQQITEERRIQMAKEELEDAAAEAERAAEAEEEARQMLQETRRLAREEREARRKAEAERRKEEKEQQRLQRRKMEDAARQREQEMAERLASAAETRRLREEAVWERQERERLEQEEREAEEEEERQRLEEEEERIRELERQAEEEALARLVKEREEAEVRMKLAKGEAERQRQEEERLRLEEERRKAEEEERQRQLEAEAEKKRQEELDRIRRIQRLEEEARERVKKELARRRAWAIRRREQNQAQRDNLNSMRRTQGMTRPWVFSYYIHWPKENYERRIFVTKKRQFRPRPKPASKTETGKP